MESLFHLPPAQLTLSHSQNLLIHSFEMGIQIKILFLPILFLHHMLPTYALPPGIILEIS